MKILHIIPSYLPARGASGAIVPIHALNKTLVKMGHEMTVYTTDLDGENILDVPLNQGIDLDGVKVFYFPVNFRKWHYSFLLHKALKNNLINFDIVHISSVFLAASALGAYYARRYDKPYVISPHGALMQIPLGHHWMRKKMYLFLAEKRNLAGARAIHLTSVLEKDEYLKAGLPHQHLTTVPYCLDTVGLKKKEQTETRKKKQILFLSRINWKKGLDTLIPAMARVLESESEAMLIIAGPDEHGYKKQIERKIADCKLKIGQHIRFVGELLGEAKAAVFQEADVFVLPSYSENFSMAVAEAMYFGLPVIVTREVGLASYIEQAAAGIVIDKDSYQLSGAILKILNDPELARKMGERGRGLVEKEFLPEKIAAAMAEQYAN